MTPRLGIIRGAGSRARYASRVEAPAKHGDAFAINLSFRVAQSWRLIVAPRERRIVFQFDARQLPSTRLAA